MELSGSKAETRTGSKQSKQKKKKVLKKESETERQRQGEPLPLLPGQDSWITTGHCPGSLTDTPHGPKIKPCTQKSWGLFNKNNRTAEIYLLPLQCRRPKIHYVQTFPLAEDIVQRTRQVSLNSKVNVRSASLL